MAFGFGDPLREKRDEFAALAAEFEALRSADTERLARYAEYRRENESARDLDLAHRSAGGDYGKNRAIEDKMRHRIPLPFGMALTVKHAYRISGRLPDAIVDRREESPQERYRSDSIEKMWWGTLHDSGAETLFAEGGWDGSQLGASCFDAYFDPVTQKARLRSVDPAGVIVVRGIEDVHDFERVFRFWDAPLESVRAQYRNHDLDGTGEFSSAVSELQSSHKTGSIPMVTMVQMGDRQSVKRFALGGPGGGVPLHMRHHGLGFAPYVVIPNIGPYRDVWGWADYEFVRALVAYIPALFGREADILRMIAGGAYVESGTGQSGETISQILANGGVIPSKRDGKVDPIQAPDIPTFAVDHAQRAVEFLKMLGFAPDASWGGSDTRSGPDRALQLQPLLELTAMKQTNWSAGLSRLASYAFRMVEQKQITTATYRGYRPGVTPGQRAAFSPFQVGPDLPSSSLITESSDPLTGESFEDEVILPRNAKELFQGDYGIRFVWQNRIDPDDPAYVLAELNKFAQGVQSLQTTLERLGFQAPEDEIKLIEQEAERIPWLRQGMIRLLQIQLAQAEGAGGAQGVGGGSPGDPLGGLMAGLGMTQTKDGSALDSDAGTAALPGGMGQYGGGA